jgi:hypothetical protein
LYGDDFKENTSQEPNSQQVPIDGSGLRPEMREFIKGILVPMLVRSYIDDVKKKAKEEAALPRAPSACPDCFFTGSGSKSK